MKKYVIWNDTHKVLGINKEFDNIEDAEKCINIIKNNIRTIIKLNGGRSKFMNPDKIQFLILDKEDYNKKLTNLIW